MISSYQGIFAHRILQSQTEAVVSGIASQGVYLQPKDELVIYLSLDKFRGPLTINLSGKPTLLAEIQPGQQALISPTRIDFPETNLQIDISQTEVWRGDLPGERLSLNNLKDRYQSIIGLAMEISAEHELFSLLEAVVSGDPREYSDIQGISFHLKAISNALENNDLLHAGKYFQKLVGLGPGLTPLGDDLILGTLLSLNRWKGILDPGQELGEFNHNLLECAQENSNRISASLFSCAVEGLGDERLLDVLDSFFTGDQPTFDQMRSFLDWGSSSGIGVMAGILVVVKRLYL